MEALMQHLKAAGFSGDVSRLAAAPSRPGCEGVVMHDRIISDMLSYMDLERHRVNMVLPEWNLGVVLEALSKSSCKPLRKPL